MDEGIICPEKCHPGTQTNKPEYHEIIGIEPDWRKFESLIKGSEPLFIASGKQYSIVAFPDDKTGTGRLTVIYKLPTPLYTK